MPAPVQIQREIDQNASDHKVMKFWSMIFPAAMEKFRDLSEVKVPKDGKLIYDIRDAKTWDEVYRKLETVRNEYANKTGIGKGIRSLGGWTAKNVANPVRIAAAVAPRTNITTPVIGAVQIIIDAVKKGSEIRTETLNKFDELEAVFRDVELFLETFQEEGPILEQAVNLVASVLLATERGIKFFTKSSLIRAGEAIVKGKDYAKPLLDSLTKITSQSQKLMELALKNHIRDFHRYSRITSRILESVQKDLGVMLTTVAESLIDCYEKRKRDREVCEDKGTSREIRHLENLVQDVSVYQPHSVWASRRLPLRLRSGSLYVDEAELWRLLDIDDVDTADLEEIEAKFKQAPFEDRARVEQIASSLAFREWITSPTSAKLMVYGNFLGIKTEISALSHFCAALAKTFRSRKRYLCLVWFCGRHLGYDDESDSDSGDWDYLDDNFYSELTEEDGYSPGTRQDVIKRMMRSLVAQLLCDYSFGPGHILPPDIDPRIINEGTSLSQLRRLFSWLVRRLPREVTLFCLVDGIFFYEREEFEDPMLDVLGDLLGLATSSDVLATIKVLVTSPRPTTTVRAGFESMNPGSGSLHNAKTTILSLDMLDTSNVEVSEERLSRNLGAIQEEESKEESGE